MKKFVSLIFITVFVVCSSAFALDLQSAKSQGLVGETPSGYLAPVKGGNGKRQSWCNQSIPNVKRITRILPTETRHHCKALSTLLARKPLKNHRRVILYKLTVSGKRNKTAHKEALWIENS